MGVVGATRACWCSAAGAGLRVRGSATPTHSRAAEARKRTREESPLPTARPILARGHHRERTTHSPHHLLNLLLLAKSLGRSSKILARLKVILGRSRSLVPAPEAGVRIGSAFLKKLF